MKLNKVEYIPPKYTSIREMLDISVALHADKDAYRFRAKPTSDEIVNITYQQFYDLTENLGSALEDMGCGKTHIACMGENSFNWITVYITVLKGAGVFVPIDKDLPTADKLHVLNESDSTVLFFSKTYEKWVREHMADLPAIKHFICFGAEEDDEQVLSYNKLLEKGATLDRTAYDTARSDPHELKFLVYTSGTTGIAKGVMLTEANLCNLLHYGLQVSQLYDVGLSVLPYHHTYETVVNIMAAMCYGTTLCINQSLKNVVKDLKVFRPQYTVMVPALAEFLHASIMRNVRQQGKEKTFESAVKLSRRLLKVGIDMRPVLFKSVREVFGGNMLKIICGGAPIRPEIGQFFNDIGIYLTGGYGITECSPLVSGNHERTINFETAGRYLACLEIRIDEPNEEGIGEICVKGPTVMKGYYKQPEKTAEVIVDGWFHTGDYGYVTKDEHIVITGRKKNIIVLHNGKNIYPEEIEGYIQGIGYIEEVIVRGLKNDKGDEVSLLAEVYLASDSTANETQILHDIQQVLQELPSYKKVTAVSIRTEPFPKTTTNKIKRQN